MDFDQIDLGLNDEYIDYCDDIDYNKLVADKGKGASTTFTVLQLNTRGVLNKHDSLKLLLNDIKKDSRVDVMLLVETWLNKTNAKLFMLPGYKLLSSHKKNKKSGAVGVLVSQEYDCRLRPDLSLNVPNFVLLLK